MSNESCIRLCGFSWFLSRICSLIFPSVPFHYIGKVLVSSAFGFSVLTLSATAQSGLLVQPGDSADLGIFPAEIQQTTSFILSNTTSRVLHLSNLKSCCAMLEPVAYETTIAPGKSAPLDVYIDARPLNGPFSKYISFSVTGAADKQTKLWIKGTALQALTTPSPHVFAGWIAVGQPWSTNVAVTLRDGLSGELEATVQSDIGMEAAPEKTADSQYRIQIKVPARARPANWSGTITLRIADQTNLPPLMVSLDGHIGGNLFPLPAKVILSSENPSRVALKLFRKHPAPPPGKPAPLTSTETAVQIEETLIYSEESSVTLIFSDAFLQRLRQEQRIPVQLDCEGFIPATLMVEAAP